MRNAPRETAAQIFLGGAHLEMPPATVPLMNEAINATAGVPHRATAFGGADQSQLTASFAAARTAREGFGRR